jgi:DNA-binding transcriptional regulator YiaG
MKRQSVLRDTTQALPQWTPEQIYKLRCHLGFSQERLAEELTMRRPTVTDWENRKKVPHRSSRLALTLLARKGRFSLGENT